MTITALADRRRAADQTVELAVGGPLLRLDKPAGHIIECIAGRVWLTQGDARDVILGAGDRIALDAGALALVSALGGPARIRTATRQSLACAA